MKKLLCSITCALALISPAFAEYNDFATHYRLGQQYLTQYQYSSSIMEFRKALRINYMDTSARIGLINAYLARASYLANSEKNYSKAMDDFRAALFYLKYFATSQNGGNSLAVIQTTTQNLAKCEAHTGFVNSAANHMQAAQRLRQEGNFPAAGYEFIQASGNQNLKMAAFAQTGDIMKVLGNDPKTAEYYQKAVAFAPNDIDLRLRYARALDRLGKEDLSIEQYSFILTKGGNDPDILYALERIYSKKMAEDPNNAEAISNHGAILQKLGRYDEALKDYSKANYLNPTNVINRMNTGTLYQEKKDYTNAILAYDSIISAYPNNSQAMLYKAQCLAAQGNNVQALETYKKVLAIDPTNAEAKKQVFETMKATMTPDEMLSYLSNDAAIDKDSVDTMYSYAYDLHKEGKLDEAIKYYQEIIKNNGTKAEVYVNLAIAYGQKKEFAKAKQVLQTAKNKFPNNKQVIDALAQIDGSIEDEAYTQAADAYDAKDYQKAIELYSKIQPATKDSLLSLAACYQALENDDMALDYYKKAYQKDPTNAEIAYFIGAYYANKENWTTAKTYLKKAQNYPKTAELLKVVIEQNNLIVLDKAIALFDKGSYDESLKYLGQILSEDNKNSYAYYYRGMIYDAQKKNLGAIEQYKKALSLNNSPDLVLANYMIAVDYDTLGQYQNAATYYQKYITLEKEDNEYRQYSTTRLAEIKGNK